MSVHLTSKVWKIQGLPPAAKLVLLKLADNANDDGVGWPSVARICAETGAVRSTVQKYVADFEARGWLKRQQREEASNIYTLTLPDPEPEPEGGARSTGGARVAGGGGPVQRAGGARVAGTEPSLNHQIEPSKGGFSKKFLAPEAGAAILEELGEAFTSHPVFALRLGEFVAERFAKGKRMTPEACHRLALKLAKHDVDTCTTALETTLDRGWTGVFPESVKPSSKGAISAQSELAQWGFGEGGEA